MPTSPPASEVEQTQARISSTMPTSPPASEVADTTSVSPPPKTQTLSLKSPAAKPQSQPSHTKNPTQSGSGFEEKEQAQPVAPPPKQATTSKKRKWSSEADQTPIASTSATENGGVGGSVGEKEYFYFSLKNKISRLKKNQMDINEERLAGSKKKVKFDSSSSSVDTEESVIKEEFVIKEALEFVGDKERQEIEEAWKKLQVRLNKLHAETMEIQDEQLMDCCLSDHSLSRLIGTSDEESNSPVMNEGKLEDDNDSLKISLGNCKK